MKTHNFNYSLKNIPIPDNTSYKLLLIEKIESFIKRIRWKAHFFLNSEDSKKDSNKDEERFTENNFGFKTKNTPPQCIELEKFEEDLLNLVKTIKFKKINDEFQTKLKTDISQIKSNPNILVFADKTSNIYELTPSQHEKLLIENITKTYKKAPPNLIHSVNLEAKNIAEKINLTKTD